MPELGRIEEVDIRELWTNEAADFTPWLAYQGGLELLGDALGLTFVSAKHEVPAGANRADVVCMEESDQDRLIKVVIENQLKKFDHRHLGQALTYANTLQAGICIWIAKEFTREHRSFVEEHNATPARKVDCYCVRVSAYRVDNSNPVPEFKVVVRPDSRIPTDLYTVPSQVVAKPGLHAPFENGVSVIEEFMARLQSDLNRRGYSAGWGKKLNDETRHLLVDIGHGIARIAVARGRMRTRVRLHMYRKGHKALYYRLERYKDSIETDVGETLDWRPPNAVRSSIDLGRDTDHADRSMWDEEIAWCLSKVDLFLEVFKWRLNALDRGESIAPAEEPPANEARAA